MFVPFISKETGKTFDIIFVFKYIIINTTNRMLPHLSSLELIFVKCYSNRKAWREKHSVNTMF